MRLLAARASAMGSRPHSDARARSRRWHHTTKGRHPAGHHQHLPAHRADRELSLFQDLLGANGSAGSGAVVVIEGPAGIGKSRLAQALYVTPKTVEVHLSNAYRKLSIRSRLQLAVALSA